jgi:putative peptidoglycan lipid II flippase
VSGHQSRPARIAGAAALIAVLTVAARIAGFGRTMVFAWAVGDNDLGDVYFAANLIPNIIFEVVAGGALAGLVVPLLAAPLAAGDRAAVSRTTAALLSWALVLLVPLAGITALSAPEIMGALDPTASPEQIRAGARMLQIFAPQLPLYGVGIVLAGVLQAHRRFAWPVLAPLLSSITVSAAYLTFVWVDGRGTGVAGLSTGGLLILAAGTTLGVVVLAGCLVRPVYRLGVRVRPRWRFDPEARRRVGGLAMAGAVTVAAQHLALLVVLWRGLAGPEGTWVLFTLSQTIFLLPWAVFAVPVATAAYPGLAEAAATGRHTRYGTTLAATTRAAVLLCLLGAAALVALATPIADLLAVLMPSGGADPGGQGSAGRLAAGIAWFAPGLVGYGLFAVLSRALYARGQAGSAAGAAAIGWAVVAGAAVGLSAVLPDTARVPALTAANSLGMTVLGAGLLLAVARGAGRAALTGLVRAGVVALLAAGLAAAAGWAVAAWTAPAGDPPAAAAVVGSGMLSGVVVGAVFGVVGWTLDRRDVRPMVATVASWLGRRLRRASPTSGAPGGVE